MQLSKNFNLKEFIESETAFKQGFDEQFRPSDTVIKNLTSLVKNLLQPARDKLRSAIYVSSGYRCPRLNKAIGGSKNSDHLYGRAADVYCADNLKLFNLLSQMEFKQLIWYYGDSTVPDFLHISYDENDNRKQVLYCYIVFQDTPNGMVERRVYRNTRNQKVYEKNI